MPFAERGAVVEYSVKLSLEITGHVAECISACIANRDGSGEHVGIRLSRFLEGLVDPLKQIRIGGGFKVKSFKDVPFDRPVSNDPVGFVVPIDTAQPVERISIVGSITRIGQGFFFVNPGVEGGPNGQIPVKSIYFRTCDTNGRSR